jgi:hypothetical protein
MAHPLEGALPHVMPHTLEGPSHVAPKTGVTDSTNLKAENTET